MNNTNGLSIMLFETQQDWERWLTEHHTDTVGIWSKVNCDKATALIAEGRMQPEGIRQVELAKADGRWESAYESQSKITIPADFQSELDKNQKAKDFFSTLDSINRYAILFRIHSAKRPATRSARINKFIEMLSNNQKM